jgi:hypothetical protein
MAVALLIPFPPEQNGNLTQHLREREAFTRLAGIEMPSARKPLLGRAYGPSRAA